MSILKKSNTYTGLDRLDVLINDESSNSLYFNIFDIPETFPGGKTAFRINGSNYLEITSEIKVEILNSEGNVIYSEYPQYLEGSSRLVSVYVYPDELFGAAILTIIGEARFDHRTQNQVPAAWRGFMNVKWQKPILIDPTLRNDSKIRFYRPPVISAQELYTPYLERTYSTSSNPEFINYNTGKISGQLVGSDYNLILTDGVFRREMIGSDLSVSSPSGYTQSYTTKIKNVLNSVTATATVPYQNTASLPGSFLSIQSRLTDQDNDLAIPTKTIYQNFKNSDYTIRYETEPTYSVTENFKSFAKININDMDTFSGDVYSTKLFMKYVGSDREYEPMGDIVLESKEMMIDSQSVNLAQRYGYLYNQDTIDTYWTSSQTVNTTTKKPINLSYTNTKLLDSMYISGSPVRGIDEMDIIYPGSQSIDFFTNTEYFIKADMFGQQKSKIKRNDDGKTESTAREAVLHIMASGSAFNDTQNLPARFAKRGKILKTIQAKQLTSGITEKYIRGIEQGFFPDQDGDGQIQFVIDSGDWYISDIGISPAQETGFSPGSTTFIIPINDWQRKQSMQFKAEFYDQRGFRADVFATSSEVYFRGSNFFIEGTDNVLTGSVFIGNAIGEGIEMAGVQSAFLRDVGYLGYYSASEGSGPAGFMIWSGSVLTDINTLYGVPRYSGVGIELHGGSGSAINPNTGKGETHALRYNTVTGRLEITGSLYATDGFFSGSVVANKILVPIGGVTGDESGSSYYDDESGKYYRAAINQAGYFHAHSGSIASWLITSQSLIGDGSSIATSGSGKRIVISGVDNNLILYGTESIDTSYADIQVRIDDDLAIDTPFYNYLVPGIEMRNGGITFGSGSGPGHTNTISNYYGMYFRVNHANPGIYFQNDYGWAMYGFGLNYGGYFSSGPRNDGNDAHGIYGVATVTEGGTSYGGYFEATTGLFGSPIPRAVGIFAQGYQGSPAASLKTYSAWFTGSVKIIAPTPLAGAGLEMTGSIDVSGNVTASLVTKTRSYLHFGRNATITGASTTVDAYTLDGVSNTYGYRMIRDGRVTGISYVYNCSTADSSDGDLNFRVQQNRVNSSMIVSDTTATTGYKQGDTTSNDFSFASGDTINVELALIQDAGDGVVEDISILIEIIT